MSQSWNPTAFASNLKRGVDDIWYADGQLSVSYPGDGHATTLELEAESFWYRHRLSAIAAVARRFLPPGPLFDIGGGTGYLAKGLQDAGIATVLVEPGQEGARSAKVRGVENVICATVEAAGFSPNSVGALGLFDVLEHIPDDLAFLTALHEILQPDGKMYLTVPAYAFLWSSHDDYMGHHRRYTRSSLARVFNHAGFRVDYVGYFFCYLPLPIFLLRALPTRFGFAAHSDTRRSREHKRALPGQRWVLDGLHRLEIAAISRGGGLPLGASLLMVATKHMPRQ